MSQDAGFDMQAAWLRRFSADAQGNLHTLAQRLKAALPEQVTLHETHALFGRAGKTTGVTVELGDRRYALSIDHGRLRASVAMVVRGITLNTRQMDPPEWFACLAEETRRATEQAKALSQSLAAFMAI